MSWKCQFILNIEEGVGEGDDMIIFVQNVCITNVFNAKCLADCEYENSFALQ